MAWKKSSPALEARFDEALPADPRLYRSKMFGYPSATVSHALFAGLHEEKVVVKVSPQALAQTEALAGAAPFNPMGDRPMKGWYIVPAAIAADGGKLRALLRLLLEKLADQPVAVKRKPAPGKKKTAAKPRRRPA